ncbi:MAG: GNAT family N-acetyltransferase [candidate division Zixibacteria bacterium]|nr:GNAT family N-acetyltransferase [candidate division Zixibacteria bacterium]
MQTVSLRPATDDDCEFLYSLTRETLHQYVVETWGAWDEAYQRGHFENKFDKERMRVIQCGSVDVGLLCLERSAKEIFIVEIEILPGYQGQGIGTSVLSDIIAEAESAGLPVRLQVLRVNPARRLYERLGFRVFDESQTHFQMRREL